MTTPLVATDAASGVVAAVARRLAVGGAGTLDDVAATVAHAVSADAVVIRGVDGVVLARHGAVDRAGPGAIPTPRAAAGQVELVARRGTVVVATLAVAARRGIDRHGATALQGVVDVLALALAAPPQPVVAGQALVDAEADRAQAVATMDDTVGHALVAAGYAVELAAAGRLDVAAVADPVRAARAAYRAAKLTLRARALEAGLRTALRGLATGRANDAPDDGQPTLLIQLSADDPALDQVAPPVAIVVQRVAEAAVRGAGGDATVTATVTRGEVKLTVVCADTASDASELARWARRAAGLGGVLECRVDGVELTLPVDPRTEGHHDDGPDLRRLPASP